MADEIQEPYELVEGSRDERNWTSSIVCRGESLCVHLPKGEEGNWVVHEQRRANEWGKVKDGIIFQTEGQK